MNKKELINKIYEIFFLSLTTLILAGCSGGSGSGSGGALGGGNSGTIGGGSIGGGGGGLSTVSNPEPSSILLLTSGLIGMAIYAKARLKNKDKK